MGGDKHTNSNRSIRLRQLASTRSIRPMTEPFSPSTDELLAKNAEYAGVFHDTDLQVAPTRNIAVVACMDSRMDIFQILGLGNGEAHIIRNAGGIITDDVIRLITEHPDA